LWREASTNQAETWLLAAEQPAAPPAEGPPGRRHPAADFNGDFRSDILFQNDKGSVAIWTMNGLNRTGGAIVGQADAGWHIKDAADLNGDGKADVVWQHDDGSVSMWTM